jgi:hypothetical protein
MRRASARHLSGAPAPVVGPCNASPWLRDTGWGSQVTSSSFLNGGGGRHNGHINRHGGPPSSIVVGLNLGMASSDPGSWFFFQKLIFGVDSLKYMHHKLFFLSVHINWHKNSLFFISYKWYRLALDTNCLLLTRTKNYFSTSAGSNVTTKWLD